MTATRFCFALDLVDDTDLIAAYERWHAPGGVPPEVLADIRAQGVVEMEIWRAGERLLMIVTAGEDFPRPRPLEPRVAEWEDLMLRFQKPLPVAAPGQKWATMTKVFTLSEHDPRAGQD
jgi:L-rhamnose mutarotase